MGGTREGGLRAAKTNIARHGKDYYVELGRRGGKNGHFSIFKEDREAARRAGAKGGRLSRRGATPRGARVRNDISLIVRRIEAGERISAIAKEYSVSPTLIYQIIGKEKNEK